MRWNQLSCKTFIADVRGPAPVLRAGRGRNENTQTGQSAISNADGTIWGKDRHRSWPRYPDENRTAIAGHVRRRRAGGRSRPLCRPAPAAGQGLRQREIRMKLDPALRDQILGAVPSLRAF